MKKIMNSAETLVREMCNGMVMAHPELEFLNKYKVCLLYTSELGEHEISYIVIHYAAALRQYNEKKSRKTKVIIVCGTGIGTSKMIAASISERFHVDIIGTYASRNVTREIINECDYVISTIDIPVSYTHLYQGDA